MKRWMYTLGLLALITFGASPASASSLAGCEFFAKIIKVRGTYQTKSSFLKRLYKSFSNRKRATAPTQEGLPVDLHILQISRDSDTFPNFCRNQLLTGTLRSVVLRGDKVKLSALRSGAYATISYSHASGYSGRKMYSSKSWYYSAPLIPTAPQLLRWKTPGETYKQVKRRLSLIEQNAANGKYHVYHTPKHLLKNTYVTCKLTPTGKLPPYCMFSAYIPDLYGRFYLTISFAPALVHGLSLKNFQKHFSYISTESTPFESLKLKGWKTMGNRTYDVVRRPQLGKRVKLLRYQDGILYGEVTNTLPKIQLYHTQPPCAPLNLSRKQSAPCHLESKHKLPVRLVFALPLGKAFERCKKNPKDKHCR